MHEDTASCRTRVIVHTDTYWNKLLLRREVLGWCNRVAHAYEDPSTKRALQRCHSWGGRWRQVQSRAHRTGLVRICGSICRATKLTVHKSIWNENSDMATIRWYCSYHSLIKSYNRAVTNAYWNHLCSVLVKRTVRTVGRPEVQFFVHESYRATNAFVQSLRATNAYCKVQYSLDVLRYSELYPVVETRGY